MCKAEGPRSAPAEVYRRSVELTHAAVHDQLSELEGIRQRTVQFLAFVGSGTAFLVGTTLTNSDRGVLFGLLCLAGGLAVAPLLMLCTSILIGATHWYLFPLVKNEQDKKRPAAMSWYSARAAPAHLLEWLDSDDPPDDTDLSHEILKDAAEKMPHNDAYLETLRWRYTLFLWTSMFLLLAWGFLAWLSGVMTHG